MYKSAVAISVLLVCKLASLWQTCNFILFTKFQVSTVQNDRTNALFSNVGGVQYLWRAVISNVGGGGLS